MIDGDTPVSSLPPGFVTGHHLRLDVATCSGCLRSCRLEAGSGSRRAEVKCCSPRCFFYLPIFTATDIRTYSQLLDERFW